MIDARTQTARLVALLDSGMSWRAAIAEVPALEDSRLIAVDRLIERAGVAAGPLLRGLLNRLDASAQAARRVELAKAAPSATLRLVSWLPLAALIFGQLAGLGSLSVLARNPVAVASVCLGVALLIAGQVWASRMVKRALFEDADDGFRYLLIESCLRAGFEFTRACNLVSEELSQSRLLPTTSTSTLPVGEFDNDESLNQIVKLSNRTGSPLADLLLALTLDREQQRLQLRLQNLESLSVRLMLPLGVSVLPAFVLIAVFPLAMSFVTGG